MECLIFGTLLGQVWTKLAQCLAYHYSYQFSQTICQSVGFLTYLLKFYSGGAVDHTLLFTQYVEMNRKK